MKFPISQTRMPRRNTLQVQPGILKKTSLCIGYLCLLYMPWFIQLEKHVTRYHLIRSNLDSLVPFCEYFVIPYLLWFPFVGIAFAWLIAMEKDRLFYRFCVMMFGGMTIALLIYTFYPNGIHLRPTVDASKNICSWILANLVYKTDTVTNVFPSLHVYTSAVIALTAGHTEIAKKLPVIHWSVVIMAALIIISTVFVKQHSVLDLLAGLIMALTMYYTVFASDEIMIGERISLSGHRKGRLI